MSGYVGVRSVAKKIDKLYVGDGAGIARAVQKAYVGDPRGVAKLWYQRNSPLGSLAVGSSVYFAVNGKRCEWIIAHQGLPGRMYDASCDGTWLLMKNIYVKRLYNTTDNSYDYFDRGMTSYLKKTFDGLIDGNVKSLVRTVKIPAHKNGNSYVSSGANGLSVNSFLLSFTEVGFKTSAAEVEGAKLDYFTDASSRAIGSVWWTRSSDPDSDDGVLVVNAKGGYTSYGYFSSQGVRPALIMSQDALVDGNGNVIGG